MNARLLLDPDHLDAFGWRRAAVAAPALAGLWWLVAGEPGSWLVGAPTVLLAAGLAGSVRAGAATPHFQRLPGFVTWFVWQSIRGGLDVAFRAFRPGPPVSPGFLRRRTHLPRDARPLLANTITLLPGTLAVRLEGEGIDIHAIDRSAAVDADLDATERRIAGLFTRPASGAPR